MKELSRQSIVIRIGNSDTTTEIGVVKLLERAGDGGRFRTAVLWENLETVLVQAADANQVTTIEFI